VTCDVPPIAFVISFNVSDSYTTLFWRLNNKGGWKQEPFNIKNTVLEPDAMLPIYVIFFFLHFGGTDTVFPVYSHVNALLFLIIWSL